jgi:NADPH:quinone reductase
MYALRIDLERHQLAPCNLPIPSVSPSQVLIRVAYAGVNHADLLQVEGKYPAPEAHHMIAGLEVSGVVEAVGAEVKHLQLGDAVCALLEGGGYGEYVLAEATLCLPVPDGISLAIAAALPEAFATSWYALRELATLQQGDSVLIEGGASGVGSIAIQLAKLLGAEVFTTARTEEKSNFVESLGATLHTDQKLDVVMDMVGGERITAHMKSLRYGGRLVSIGCMAGAEVSFSMAGLLMKNLRWCGMTLRSQSLETKARIMKQIHTHCWAAVESSVIAPHINNILPLSEAENAHARMRGREHIGKILLQVIT